jgi:hypothetical protein|tara:strand:+ start:635 stop:943 length:309 start_codon:yes stop_codon:yes gene_type:complete
MANRLRNIEIKRDVLNKRRYYKNIEYPVIPVSSNDVYIISKIGDRLDLLANDFYNDPQLWWVISRANPDKINRDSFFIDSGLQIRIPTDVQDIYTRFNKINK